MEHGRHRGTVRKFDAVRGFGFIRPDAALGKDIFVHQTAINMSGYRTLSVDDVVEFDIEQTDKGIAARNVTRVSPTDEPSSAAAAWE